MGHTSVLCLQETHGTCAQVNSILSTLTGRFLLFHSPFLDPLYHGGVDPMLDSGGDFEFDSDGKKIIKTTGGLITLVSKNLASLSNCNFEIIIPGRATRLAIFDLGKVSVTFNIHNERLSAEEFRSLESRISADISEAKSNPHSFSVNIAGDLNIPPPGSEKRNLDKPSAEGPVENTSLSLYWRIFLKLQIDLQGFS